MSVRMSLLDWIVAIVIILVLTSLLIPPMHMEHSWKGCHENLRQISQAFLAYHNRHGVFPPSADLAKGHSCFLYVLPDLEQQALYNSYNLSMENWSAADNGSGRSNAAVSGTDLPFLKCYGGPFREPIPASEIVRLDGTRYPGTASFARGSYAVNWGGGRQGWGSDFELTCGTNRGPMNPTGSLSVRDITDGASQTILVGEKRDSLGWNVGGWAGSEFDVRATPGYDGDAPWASKVYTGSFHRERAQFAFADGSVHSLPSRLNSKIWYALITRDGGEPLFQRRKWEEWQLKGSEQNH